MDVSWRGGGLQNTKYKPSLGVGIAMHPTKNTKKTVYIHYMSFFSEITFENYTHKSHDRVSYTVLKWVQSTSKAFSLANDVTQLNHNVCTGI